MPRVILPNSNTTKFTRQKYPRPTLDYQLPYSAYNRLENGFSHLAQTHHIGISIITKYKHNNAKKRSATWLTAFLFYLPPNLVIIKAKLWC